ncbi:MAG TPA: winged helix-turn-helix transcriptional regulator [Candidatus Bathyarchaeota archaeon]|nr:winged helix-turn-helix transcriptional regulator [Candidatus Bathyarchaeota archaeon]
MSVTEETLADYRLLDIRKLATVDAEQDFKWICRSLGFLESRDKKRTAHKIFRTIVEAARHNRGLSSDELAEKLSLSRGAMVHHLNKLIKGGLVIYHEGRYKLRERNLKTTIEEINRDISRIFDNLYNVAESVDDTLGFPSR